MSDRPVIGQRLKEFQQREVERTGTTVDANALGSLAIRCEFLFKCRDFAPQRELTAVKHAVNCRIDFSFDRNVLRLQVDKRNHDGFPLRCM